MSEMREGAIQTNSKLHSKDSIVFWSSANSFFTEDREGRKEKLSVNRVSLKTGLCALCDLLFIFPASLCSIEHKHELVLRKSDKMNG